ncbi:hypothetical protein HYQ46_000538 [Verticillium longisporum]|nr:hypothetical protein HYQ46_000538 [Verticillium longisporum]
MSLLGKLGAEFMAVASHRGRYPMRVDGPGPDCGNKTRSGALGNTDRGIWKGLKGTDRGLGRPSGRPDVFCLGLPTMGRTTKATICANTMAGPLE